MRTTEMPPPTSLRLTPTMVSAKTHHGLCRWCADALPAAQVAPPRPTMPLGLDYELGARPLTEAEREIYARGRALDLERPGGPALDVLLRHLRR